MLKEAAISMTVNYFRFKSCSRNDYKQQSFQKNQETCSAPDYRGGAWAGLQSRLAGLPQTGCSGIRFSPCEDVDYFYTRFVLPCNQGKG